MTRTSQFLHLTSSAFLCIIPQSMIHLSSSAHFLELLPGPFETILQGLNKNKQAVVVAVKGLLWPSRRNRVLEVNSIDEDD